MLTTVILLAEEKMFKVSILKFFKKYFILK